ncbi:MAG: N-acetyl-alpha-D-glucosaminyl-diphospho-ditrans,octacis-undecaprenol 4-epimerase [Myxococcota bacterium]|nr:N-acetyl-alpha-D-glucosaminyl-diphospho-ditrans,octacis-undecaprenol 4-epimerase [Myxococcota bacterium]
MKTVLVTGATGFVGKFVCERLLADGWSVRAAVRDPARQPPPGVQSIPVGDIGPDTEWSKALDGADAVIHLAALAHQVGAKGEELRRAFDRVNADGTRALARACAASSGVRRLVFVSSIGAVATLSETVITESAAPSPDSDYGRGKLAAEQAVRDELRNSRCGFVIIRPPLIYGPGNPGNMARLLSLLKTGAPLPLAGVRNRRSFLYVENLSDALVRCIESPGVAGKTYVIRDGETCSTPELLRLLGEVSGRPARLFSVPMAVMNGLAGVGDMLSAIAGRSVGLDTYSLERLTGSLEVDDSALRRDLPWTPPFSMREGLRRTFGQP